ncbi:putative late blight resistance protein homolog R1A-10 isoform X2 [Salvia splendens]|uniref:putative late blight resistance protein homolog R1A-10 isoform X2 n=1 Tax=Salvia splendens TaxID=180675 RepID=UPI001C262336|nr:putative late blight resistance protein homolog R1A-10 isoform X2 [Salvia splendens]
MAYAVVISLKQTLEPLLDSARSRIQFSGSELHPIYKDLCYLTSFFDKMTSLEDCNSVEEMEKDIKEILLGGQDLIEHHLSDAVHSAGDASWTNSAGFSRELGELKHKLAPFINLLKAKENELTRNQQLPTADVPVPVPVPVPSKMDHEIVGLEDEIPMLQELILGVDPKLQEIYVVGMFGIGKTTLTNQVYNSHIIHERFDIRLFVTVGVENKLEELLLRILSQVQTEVKKEETVLELGNRLRASLSRGTYLVILDDLRDMRVWDHLRPYFPDEGNSSRIVFTTRMTNLDCVRKYIHQKRLLDSKESWELFCKIVFADMEMYNCPSELEEIGKTIARNMGGLPLALVEIGKLVSKLQTMMERWAAFAQYLKSHIQKTAIPKVMNDELPNHLKGCFLHLGLLHPNNDFPTYELIKLWVVEGFIEPAADQSLEQIAEEYLEDLVSRGLVIVHERSYTGRIKTCGIIHNLIQEVCVGEARQQKLFHIVNKGATTKNQRRLSIQSDVVLGEDSGARSLVFLSPENQHPLAVFKFSRWARVVHALHIRFSKFPDEVLKLVRLRYLAITFDGELPSSISTLWNLQVLIIFSLQATYSPVFLPVEIWELQKLRHLHCLGFDLPVPSTDLYLRNLLTLSGVSFRTCCDGVLARIPHLIKLGVRFDPGVHGPEISCSDALFNDLHQFESFKCAVTNTSKVAFSLEGFPSGLTKLTLGICGFKWDDHTTILSELPNLQVLKLRRNSFSGPKWELRDDVYRFLKFLVLEDLDIKEWIAESEHFPALQQLLIRRCYYLQEIPVDMGEITTLKVIEVDDCNKSLRESARRIQEEQEDIGNVVLQVRIRSSSNDGEESEDNQL